VTGHIANHNCDICRPTSVKLYKIIIVTAGFIAVDTFACYIKTFYPGIFFWQEVLLNPSVISLMTSPVYPISSFETT
jgi:hypothetical protein